MGSMRQERSLLRSSFGHVAKFSLRVSCRLTARLFPEINIRWRHGPIECKAGSVPF
jgi:hypothetical protein